MQYEYEELAVDKGQQKLKFSVFCLSVIVLSGLLFLFGFVSFNGDVMLGFAVYIVLLSMTIYGINEARKIKETGGRWYFRLDASGFDGEVPNSKPFSLDLNSIDSVELVRGFDSESKEKIFLISDQSIWIMNMDCDFDVQRLLEVFESFGVKVVRCNKREAFYREKKINPVNMFNLGAV